MSLPTSPTNNQTTVLNGITYQYNSANSSWTRVPGVITATTNLIISGTTPATSTNTGALQVYGGVGIGGALWVGTTSYIAGAQILTTANVNTFVTSGVSSINAGTDTAVNQTTGAVTIWNTSTLQSITSRGSSTNYAISITNTSSSTGTNTGALTVTGGVGIGGQLNAASIQIPVSNASLTLGSSYVNPGTSNIVMSQGFTGALVVITSNVGTLYGGVPTGLKLFSNGAGTIDLATYDGGYGPTGQGIGLRVNSNRDVYIYNTTSATSTTSGALQVVGGVGVGGSVYVGNRVGFVNTANVSVVYQVYNPAASSLDFIFG